MRKIEFRGISRITNEMIFGNLIIDHDYKEQKEDSFGELVTTDTYDMYSINCDSDGRWHEIDPTTLGQLTGLEDKNGVEIWEGDVLSKKWLCVVYKDKNTGAFMVRFGLNPKGNKPRTLYQYLKDRNKAGTADTDNVVISNIHKNPELLLLK